MNKTTATLTLATWAALTAIAPAHAGENFQVRYNIAGSLGGEVFAPTDAVGFAVGIAHTFADIRKLTGGDGHAPTRELPGGTVPLTGIVPPALYPTYDANAAKVDGTGTVRATHLAAAYITQDKWADGRLMFSLSVPYAVKTQTLTGTAATPALHWDPAVPAALQGAVNGFFDKTYQARVAAQAAAGSGRVSSWGDAELQAGWLYTAGRVRVLAGTTLIAPTGRNNADPTQAISLGNFYTWRPAVQATWLPTPDIALAGKLTLGHNTRNKDDDIRSGDWAGLEAAAAYKTPVGVVGLHSVYVHQYQADSNNPWGASRLRSMNAGAFFTTKLPVVDAIVTAQYMTTTDSRYAKAGNFTQVRAVKLF